VTFDEAMNAARSDRERLLVVAGRTREVLRLVIVHHGETLASLDELRSRQIADRAADREEHGHLADDLLVAAQAINDLREEVRKDREARNKREADLAAGLVKEGAARAQADSIHEEQLGQVEKKTEAVDKKVTALGVAKSIGVWTGRSLGVGLAVKLIELLTG
jgi:hydroxylamine reductase (hybrid-cluster protein)